MSVLSLCIFMYINVYVYNIHWLFQGGCIHKYTCCINKELIIQCGKIDLRGLTDDELQNYDLPVIPCDESTYNYCRFQIFPCVSSLNSGIFRLYVAGTHHILSRRHFAQSQEKALKCICLPWTGHNSHDDDSQGPGVMTTTFTTREGFMLSYH